MANFVKASLTQKSAKAKAKENAAKLSKIYTAKSPLPTYMSQQLMAAQASGPVTGSPNRVVGKSTKVSTRATKFNNRKGSIDFTAKFF